MMETKKLAGCDQRLFGAPRWVARRGFEQNLTHYDKFLPSRTSVRARLVVAGVASAALLSGCAVTQRASVTGQSYCPFLCATVCAELTPTTDKKEADLRYINPNAQWTQYNKVLIEPVTFWGGDSTKLSAADQRTLTNFFYQAL